FIASGILWIATAILVAVGLRRPPEDQAPLAMGATFGNTVMLGIPIAVSAFGQEALSPIALLIAVEAPLMWIVATLHIEVAKRGRNVSRDAVVGVLKDLATNTIILSLLLGLAGRMAGLSLPEVPDRILQLLGQVAIPSALFALGMALATFRVSGEGGVVAILSAVKLLALPALVYVLAAHVFHLPPLWVAATTLHAAMPVGANAFLFAARYDRLQGTVSAAIAASTMIAVVTVSLLLLVLQPLARG
ncbi:MAG: AEC family transporter, partial [Beijerinckiaceae bacterium]